MPPLPIVRPKQVIKVLQGIGFIIVRQTGSHIRLVHQTESRRRVTIPFHKKDLKKGTLKSILQQAELSVKDFIQLL